MCLGVSQEDDKVGEYEELSLRRWEIMYAPSGVGSSVGVVVRYTGVTTLIYVRYDIAVSMPCMSAWRKYP